MIPSSGALGRGLTDAELDRLEDLLDSPALAETAMRTDALHGFLTAVVSSPVPIPRERWLAEALGTAVEGGDAREAAALVERLYADIALVLLEGHGVDPLLYPLGDAPGEDAADDDAEPELDYATWCQGYLAGVDLADPPWSEFTEQEEIDARLAPFIALAMQGDDTDDVPNPFEGLPEDELADFIDMARERLPEATQEVYDHLDACRPKAEPIRRDADKVGRNDPCPCGSGKKFKKCHGAA
jgi:uncharacterized protein